MVAEPLIQITAHGTPQSNAISFSHNMQSAIPPSPRTRGRTLLPEGATDEAPGLPGGDDQSASPLNEAEKLGAAVEARATTEEWAKQSDASIEHSIATPIQESWKPEASASKREREDEHSERATSERAC